MATNGKGKTHEMRKAIGNGNKATRIDKEALQEYLSHWDIKVVDQLVNLALDTERPNTKALEMFLHYRYGKPVDEFRIEQNTNITHTFNITDLIGFDEENDKDKTK